MLNAKIFSKIILVTILVSLDLATTKVSAKAGDAIIEDRVATSLNSLLQDNDALSKFKIGPSLKQKSIQETKSRPEATPFIIGGTTAPRSRYREFALVIFADNAGNINGLCGGTMIASDRVLTAAHCSQGRASNFFIVPSFYSLNDQLTASTVFQVFNVAVHPDYNAQTFSNDVAVMTTFRSSPAPTAAVLSGSNKLVDQPGIAIGIGLTATNPARTPNFLQEVAAPIISNASCNDNWTRLVGIRPIQDNMICAGFVTDGRGTCSGDSGGPLFVIINGERVIAGTVSFGLANCEQNRGTQAYARMTSFTDFIQSQSFSTRFIQSNNPARAIVPILGLLLQESTEPLGPLDVSRINPPIADSFQGKFIFSTQILRRNPLDTFVDRRVADFKYTQLNSVLSMAFRPSKNLNFTFRGAGIQNVFIGSEESWNWQVPVPAGQTELTPGIYKAIAGRVGVTTSSYLSNCQPSDLIDMRIFDIEYDQDEIVKLVADFRFECESQVSAPPVIGSVDYDKSRPDAVNPRPAPVGGPSPSLPDTSITNNAFALERSTNSIARFQALNLNDSNTMFSVSRDPFSAAGLEFEVTMQNGATTHRLKLQRPALDTDTPADEPISVGHYEPATEADFTRVLPGLEYTVNSLSCPVNSYGGRFNIYELELALNGLPTKLLADFELSCGEPNDLIKGSIRLDLTP